MHYAQRRTRLRARLAEGGLGAMLVSKPVNVRYLSGFTGSAGQLLVGADRAVLVTDGRYREQAGEEAPDLELVVTRGDGWLDDHLDGVARLGLESHAVSWDRARRLTERVTPAELVPAPHLVETLRQTKDADELEILRQACAITVGAFQALCGWLTRGLTEVEVARRLDADLAERGAQGPAFDTIVAAGPNGARPHHRPTARRLEAGDLVTVDFGALVDGYHADMTRTVALGEPAGQLGEVHRVVHDAQRAGVRTVGPEVEAGDVDSACRELISAAGYGDAFVHGTGHGLGLEIHEDPILRRGADARLTLGMTVTVEPGIYLPGTGGVRIEDVVAVTASGPEVLTEAPREPLVL